MCWQLGKEFDKHHAVLEHTGHGRSTRSAQVTRLTNEWPKSLALNLLLSHGGWKWHSGPECTMNIRNEHGWDVCVCACVVCVMCVVLSVSCACVCMCVCVFVCLEDKSSENNFLLMAVWVCVCVCVCVCV